MDKAEQSTGSLLNAGSDEWSSTEKHLTIEGKKGLVLSLSAKMIPGEELSKFSCALCFALRNALSKCAFHPRAASEICEAIKSVSPISVHQGASTPEAEVGR